MGTREEANEVSCQDVEPCKAMRAMLHRRLGAANGILDPDLTLGPVLGMSGWDRPAI